jgi:hypothetical protein
MSKVLSTLVVPSLFEECLAVVVLDAFGEPNSAADGALFEFWAELVVGLFDRFLLRTV